MQDEFEINRQIAYDAFEWLEERTERGREEDFTYEEQIGTLVEIRDRFEAVAKELGLRAVEQKSIKQAELARMMEKHPLTISRWLKSRRDDRDNQPGR